METNKNNLLTTKKCTVFYYLLFFCFYFFLLSCTLNAADSDEDLLLQYIKSKNNDIIVFDASNIKQFWIDSSVASQNGHFNILLNREKSSLSESVPLKIQLANVNLTQNCTVEVISDTEDIAFSVLNNKSEVLSSSEKKDNFLSYHIADTSFHLEDTSNYSFSLKFSSKKEYELSIKKIILSFSENKETDFLTSPGEIKYSQPTLITSSSVASSNDNALSVTGKNTVIFSKKKIFVTDNTLSSTVTIKNIGDTATTIFLGYQAFSHDGVWLNGKNYPAFDKVLKVVSAQKGKNTIIVDSYSDWKKGCYLALNAQDDLSDIPNSTFANGTISEMKKLENGQAEITLSTSLTSEIKEGTKVRVHGASGSYLYTRTYKLQPGEEQTFSSKIKKDNSFLDYSAKAFAKGVYYVVPIILSYSVDASKDNTILISNYSISY